MSDKPRTPQAAMRLVAVFLDWLEKEHNCINHEMQDYLRKFANNIDKAIDVVENYATIDGGHHKQWVIDQFMRELLGDDYEAWKDSMEVKEEDGDGNCYVDEWDTGIAP